MFLIIVVLNGIVFAILLNIAGLKSLIIMNKIIPFLFITALLCLQCKTDTAPVNVLADLESKLATEPSPANANNVVNEINKMIATEENEASKKSLISKGLEISKKHNLTSKTASFITMGLRTKSDVAGKKESLIELASLMEANKKTKTSSVLYQAIADLYPDDTRSPSYAAKAKESTGGDVHTYLLKTAETIFDNPDEYGINRKNSSEYVNACEAYALSYDDDRAPDYLYKAAEIARSLRTFPKTLSLYDWIIDSYPNYEKTPTALFLKGFVIENELKNEDLARESYSRFLSSYPKHDLADDVQFLLDNLGKSNEEILDLIEKNKEERENAQ